MDYKIDLIAVDAGSVDAGPYYLGSHRHYVAEASLIRDLTWMIRGALVQDCPLIIGSAGFSGADPQFTDTVRTVERIIQREAGGKADLAWIDSRFDPALVGNNCGLLMPLGRMPELDADILNASKIVGQMGIPPIVTALDAGARFIVCGRAYDPAVFAADPIRQGFDPGIAYHAGKILECGAIACLPGSGSDCLMAELDRDGGAEFFSPGMTRRTTVASIAAHTLYEKSRPDLFPLPGGWLSIRETEFYEVDKWRAGIRNSRFIQSAPSVKLEGSRPIGRRTLSIVPLADLAGVPEGVPVYGRNGVEAACSPNEMGILAMVVGPTRKASHDVLAQIRSTLLHYGYPGRMSTAGNIAFPCSPSDIDTKIDGRPCAFFIAGARDPVFQRMWPEIKKGVLDKIGKQLPELAAKCRITLKTASADSPIAFVETMDDPEAHKKMLRMLYNRKDPPFSGLEEISVGEVYQWSVYHLLHDRSILKDLFPVQLRHWNGRKWGDGYRLPCDWRKDAAGGGAVPDPDSYRVPHLPLKVSGRTRALTDMADVIRSKNAGINELTFDILFSSDRSFLQALSSGAFTEENMAEVLDLPVEAIDGIFQFPIVRAIKLTIHRNCLAGNPGDRDVFGAQQQGRILAMRIPV